MRWSSQVKPTEVTERGSLFRACVPEVPGLPGPGDATTNSPRLNCASRTSGH